MARTVFLFGAFCVTLLAVYSVKGEDDDVISEDMSMPITDYIDDVDFDLDTSREKRAVGPYEGYNNAGYRPCGSPEGIPGTCKPLATCASYYGSPQHYNNGYGRYSSCTYGYGYYGVCCPDVIYSGWKPAIINYHPKKYGHHYDGNYAHIPGHGIQQAAKYCEDYMKKNYENDDYLGKDENHVSYWGNGIAKEKYLLQFADYGWAGYLGMCMTEYVQKYYGYNPYAYYEGGLKLAQPEYSQYLPAKYNQICHSYYKQCYPSKYRSIEGYCNNLRHSYWGAASSAMGHIKPPSYYDQIWKVRYSKAGKPLPDTRLVHTHVLPNKNVEEPSVNVLYTNYGQFVIHDVTHSTFYQSHSGLFLDCCQGYKGGEHHVHTKCYAVPVPHDDKFYSAHGQKCLNFARALISPNYDCALGYASPLNYQTSYIDLSLVYGSHRNISQTLRTHKYGLLKMSKVEFEYYMPNMPKEAECFKGAGEFCMLSGDFRTTMHPGMTMIQIIAVRFHNLCAKKMYYYNPYWNDEKIYQECRRISIAVFQHITFNEYLPLTLGWKFMYDYGLLSVTKGHSWDYSERIIPWTFAEGAGAALRHHSMVYGKIALVNEYYQPTKFLELHHYYNNDKLYLTPDNFNGLLRGYMWSSKRRMDVYYDQSIANYLLMDPARQDFGVDIVAFNMQRGREFGVGTYNDFREICGLKRAYKWEDFYDTIAPYTVNKFREFYEHPDDLDLYAGGVSEQPVKDSLLGPVFWCIAGYQFQHWKWGDRYFYTLGGMPSSFSLRQLDEIRKMSMAAMVCMTTTVKHVPAMAFRTHHNHTNPLESCYNHIAIPRINFAAFSGY